MFNEIKIGSKITALLLAVVLLSVFAISYLSYRLSKNSIEERYWESLKVMSALIGSRLESVFQQLEYTIDEIDQAERVKQAFVLIASSSATTDPAHLADSLHGLVKYDLPEVKSPISKYHNFLLLDANGVIVYKADREKRGQAIGQGFIEVDAIREKARDTVYYGNLYKTSNDSTYINVTSPIKNDTLLLGYLVAQYKMDEIYAITQDSTGLRNTGEIIIGKLSLSGSKVDFLNKPRNSTYSLLTQSILIDDQASEDMQKAVKEKADGFGYTRDYRDETTLSVWKYLQKTGWGLVIKIDKDEINKDLDYLIIAFIFAGVFIIFTSFAVSILFSKFLIVPLLLLKGKLGMVAKGVLPEQVSSSSNDEIGEMASAVGELVAALKRTANFARRIGEGNYDADFQPMSQDDTLGNALITMRDNIQRSEKKDDERNWIITGVAEIGQILRLYNRLDELGDAIVSFVTKKINAIQGAFYVVNEENGKEAVIELTSSYAYSKKKYLKATYRFAEGLVGQAAIEEDTILRTEVPDEYMTITSGILGDQKPRCLLIVPLMTDEKVFGVIELASFQRFTDTEVSFVQEISLIIARTIFNIKVNQRTIGLLQESQLMSEELQQKQEVLRQNAEVMAATQEELTHTNLRLEEQIEEVNRTQKRMQLLLENASEVITIYESDGKVRYISPSVTTILGYTPDEMIGKYGYEHVDADSLEAFQEMFRMLLENDEEQITIQYEYKLKDNTIIWLEATGNNLISDNAVQGIVVNVRDITERRMAERESRMRSQMQSLSENSPDLIVRLNNEGRIFYINPTIRHLTGLLPQDISGRNLLELPLANEISENWGSILAKVSESRANVNREMPFPTSFGERIMQVNAIPEYNEEEEIESVLVVSHDITERKAAELEILSINKKVSESINYAQRIQHAIMPNTKSLRHALPDSFIYYKPRDVVSGDFPWFMQKGDDIFIAAVDCTGHGVPGALISVIGYFILNDIVNTQNAKDVGIILDLLNDGVTQTLRQENLEASSRDGMDIGLCRINFKNKEVQYSGAHRPLYYVKDGIFDEIKGDRFPIGGGQHKNREKFNATTFKISEGDQLYLFTDGFPDQFGGIENRKYSPRQLRELIMNNQGINMEEMNKRVGESVYNWKGEKPQTDDILMIGIKF